MISKESLWTELSLATQAGSRGKVRSAFNLAFDGHNGQFRDHVSTGFEKVPYIVHPVGVALIAMDLLRLVTLSDADDVILATCLVHDLLEDTKVTRSEILRATSNRVLELAVALTKPAMSEVPKGERRIDAFMRQVIAAGPTAMFIKACDFLHNISRPQSTPLRLLKKAIANGRSSFQSLFDEGRLPTSLHEEFQRRLSLAEGEYIRLSKSDKVASEKYELSTAISRCVEYAGGKVMEEHDVIEALAELTNASFVEIGAAQEVIESAIVEVHEPVEQRVKARVLKMAEQGLVDCTDLPANWKQTKLFSVDRIYVVPVQIAGQSQSAYAIGVEDSSCPSWLSCDALQLLVGFMKSRQTFHVSKENAEYAQTLAQYGLSVDVELARRSKFRLNDLKNLRAVLDFAEYCRLRVTHALSSDLKINTVIGAVPSLYSRVKTPESVIRKVVERKLQGAGDIDDLIGLRVICINESQCRQFSEKVSNSLRTHIGVQNGLANGSNRSGLCETSAGYRATHLYFHIPPGTLNIWPVNLEVQIRTAFQDAWASVAHATVYKTSQRPNPELRDLWKKCALLRNEIDDALNQLPSELGSPLGANSFE
jgi:ppGpp synthetase/RelA/SpoT-type nucleotidyltranferase